MWYFTTHPWRLTCVAITSNSLCSYVCVNVKKAAICFQAVKPPLCDVQFIPIGLPDALPIFELLVSTTDEVPQLCIGITESATRNPNSRQFAFDIVELSTVLWSSPGMLPNLCVCVCVWITWNLISNETVFFFCFLFCLQKVEQGRRCVRPKSIEIALLSPWRVGVHLINCPAMSNCTAALLASKLGSRIFKHKFTKMNNEISVGVIGTNRAFTRCFSTILCVYKIVWALKDLHVFISKI